MTMLATIILIAAALGLIILFMKIAMGGWAGGGGSTNMTAGATFDLMSKDQQRAMEVIVRKEAGEKQEEQESGEPEKK